MHPAAYSFIAGHAAATQDAAAVLDVGGRDVNGSPRGLWPDADYVALDLVDGPGVDIVADGAVWLPDRLYDVVVCAEVLEHTPRWRDVLATCVKAARPGGLIVVTCATDPRSPHSAVDGGELRPGEYYGNVDIVDLYRALGGLPVTGGHVPPATGDLQVSAVR